MSKSKDFNLYGSLLYAFLICPRQAWLMSRQISGDQTNTMLEIGRIIDEKTFTREKKEIRFGSNIFDMVKTEDGKVKLIEVKKSSKMLEAAKMQLLYYIYCSKLEVEAEIRIPKEKKIIKVELTQDNKELLENIIFEIIKLIDKNKPPLPIMCKFCKQCSYSEFCWA